MAARRHSFGRPRLTREVFNLSNDMSRFSSSSFHPLPPPTGAPPFHLDLADVLPSQQMQAIKKAKKLVFHIAGDAGGIRDAVPQQLVAEGMERDFKNDPNALGDDPKFFYMLGDCVYFNGQTSQYFPQFYEPYEHYLAPIFAVPGNHDGDNVAPEDSLDAFVRNFCAAQPGTITPEAGESTRTAMTQPNVFWTLDTPFATIVGLYTNVPEGGSIHPDQQAWLTSELKNAPKDRALFVTMHHPVISADVKHSGSTAMKTAIDNAIASSGRVPSIIFAGHVHNYQRFTTKRGNRVLPYIVAGGAGYHNLHQVVKVNGQKLVPPVRIGTGPNAPMLESYVDTRHGFLRIEVTATTVEGKYYSVARPHESWSEAPHLADIWTFDWPHARMIENALPHATVSVDALAAVRDPRFRHHEDVAS